MARHKKAEARHQEEVQEHTAKVIARQRQQGLVTLNPNLVPKEDANDIGALIFPSDIEDMGEPSRMGDYLTTSSSDKLSDLLIT